MENQRLRNLTTGRLHTKMDDIYLDIEYLTGEEGVMTHMLPNALKAIRPYLEDHVKDKKFWNGEYDTSHNGDTNIPPMNKEDQNKFWAAFSKMKSPIFG